MSAINKCTAKNMSKYALQSLSQHKIKEHMWNHFVDISVMNGKLSVF